MKCTIFMFSLSPFAINCVLYNQFGDRKTRSSAETETMCTEQMHRDARLQMREELHCRWCTAVGRSRFAAAPRVMCGNLACAHAPNFCARTHFPRFLVRVSGKRSCHAKLHNNRGATVISCPAVTTNCKSSAEAVEFSLTSPCNFVHLDGVKRRVIHQRKLTL